MDYGMIRYTDLEVANHSIMIQNLPKNIPNKDLQKQIRQFFEEILSKE